MRCVFNRDYTESLSLYFERHKSEPIEFEVYDGNCEKCKIQGHRNSQDLRCNGHATYIVRNEMDEDGYSETKYKEAQKLILQQQLGSESEEESNPSPHIHSEFQSTEFIPMTNDFLDPEFLPLMKNVDDNSSLI